MQCIWGSIHDNIVCTANATLFCILLTSMRCHLCELWYHRLGCKYCTHKKVRAHQQYTQWQWSLGCRSWVPQVWLQEQLLLKTCWRQPAIGLVVWNLQNYSLKSRLLLSYRWLHFWPCCQRNTPSVLTFDMKPLGLMANRLRASQSINIG